MHRLRRWLAVACCVGALALGPAMIGAAGAPADHVAFGDVFRYQGVPMLWIEPDSGRIVDANEAAALLYGRSVVELRRQRIQDINLLSERQVAEERQRAAAQHRSFFLFPHRVANGEVRTVAVYSVPYRVGEQPLLLSFVLDLSAHSVPAHEQWRLDALIQTALAEQRDALAQTQRKELWLLAAVMGLGTVVAVLVTAALGLRRRAQWATAQRQQAQQALQMRETSLQQLARSAHGMQLALQGAGLGTWDWDLRRDCLQLDPPALQVLGHSAATLPTLNMARWLDLIAPADRSLFEHAWARHLSGQQPLLECELRLRHRDGHELPALLRGQVMVRGDDGTPWRVAGVLADLSTLHEYQRAASLAEQVFRHTHEAVMVTDAQGRIVRVNDAFGRLTGYAPDDVMGHNPSLLASGRHDRAFFAAMWNALQTQGHWSGEIWNRRRDGALMANWMTISVMRDPRGEVQGYVGVFHDITQRKQTEAELQRTALTDALTGLGNRVLLHDRLQQAMARTARHGACLAVVMLDLDGFKTVNDTHGHAAGDRLLIALAQRLRALVREVDTVVRLGGDEFVLLLPDLIRPQDAEPLVQRILHAMAQPVDDASGPLQVSASIGVSYHPQEPPVDADTLLHQADEAMYWAKRSGRNRYAVWSPALASNGGTSLAATAGANHQP